MLGCHSSNAYTLSCSVATKRASCRPLPGASTPPEEERLRIDVPIDFQREDLSELCAFTLRGVSVVSPTFAPVRALSFCAVVICAPALSPKEKTRTVDQPLSFLNTESIMRTSSPAEKEYSLCIRLSDGKTYNQSKWNFRAFRILAAKLNEGAGKAAVRAAGCSDG